MGTDYISSFALTLLARKGNVGTGYHLVCLQGKKKHLSLHMYIETKQKPSDRTLKAYYDYFALTIFASRSFGERAYRVAGWFWLVWLGIGMIYARPLCTSIEYMHSIIEYPILRSAFCDTPHQVLALALTYSFSYASSDCPLVEQDANERHFHLFAFPYRRDKRTEKKSREPSPTHGLTTAAPQTGPNDSTLIHRRHASDPDLNSNGQLPPGPLPSPCYFQRTALYPFHSLSFHPPPRNLNLITRGPTAVQS